MSQWTADRAPRLAAALAFYTILSLTPLLLISTAIAGFFFGEETARGQIVSQLQRLIVKVGAEVVRARFFSFAMVLAVGFLLLVSLVVLVVWIYYSGLIFFFGAELTQVLARKYGRVEPSLFS